MTPEQQRIAIAKACGWKQIEVLPGFKCRTTQVVGFNIDEARCGCVPDYPSDLNAMHEAEKVLTEKQRGAFSAHLVRITNWNRAQDSVFGIAHATAAQRAEAFLRTLNLWTDEN